MPVSRKKYTTIFDGNRIIYSPKVISKKRALEEAIRKNPSLKVLIEKFDLE